MTRAADPRPNILIVFSDQQRWDTLGVNGSPMGITPHLDRLAREGTRFLLPITNQPVCAPARACLLSGQYATSHGVWRNGFGLAPDTPTLATCLAGEGYQTGYVGKWHLAGREHGHGAVPPEARGGFADFWEAANVPELVSRPFETVLYDGAGAEVRPPGYRVDATTDRTIAALRQFAGEGAAPFVQMVSFLEPHHQNDVDRYVPPEGYEARYANPYVPPDLRPLPGNWQTQLPGYYGCVASLDENVGRLLQALEETGQLEQTIVVYTADHGCHFRTRNAEYKRSCHDASLRIPLVIWGGPFSRRQVVPEPVGLVDLLPTLLDAAGVAIPETVAGALPAAPGPARGVRLRILAPGGAGADQRVLHRAGPALGALDLCVRPRVPPWPPRGGGAGRGVERGVCGDAPLRRLRRSSAARQPAGAGALPGGGSASAGAPRGADGGGRGGGAGGAPVRREHGPLRRSGR